MKKTGLGRGLDALLPDSTESENNSSLIPLTELDPNPGQPRRGFDDESLRALADSIREAGVLQPLLAVRMGGRYRIVAGERRFRAAHLAGLAEVPCIVRDMTEQEQMAAALIENIQREDWKKPPPSVSSWTNAATPRSRPPSGWANPARRWRTCCGC